MLYLSKYDSGWLHEKYQFHDLYKTKDNRWASPYDWLDDRAKESSSKPVTIDFRNEVSFSIAGMKKREIKERYPGPYFKISGNKAIAVYGHYVPELLENAKKGVLRSRGIFGPPQDNKIKEQEITLTEYLPVNPSDSDIRGLRAAWKNFLDALATKNDKKIKELSLDSVTCSVCEGFTSPHFYNDPEPIDTFVASSYTYFPGTAVWEYIQKNKYKIRVSREESRVEYSICFELKTNYDASTYTHEHRFIFVKINGVFRFRGMTSNLSSIAPG